MSVTLCQAFYLTGFCGCSISYTMPKAPEGRDLADVLQVVSATVEPFCHLSVICTA